MKARKYIVPKITYPIIIAATLLLPSEGAYGISPNWDDHDRSGKYTAVMQKPIYTQDPNAHIIYNW
jgi:hypothetical protein